MFGYSILKKRKMKTSVSCFPRCCPAVCSLLRAARRQPSLCPAPFLGEAWGEVTGHWHCLRMPRLAPRCRLRRHQDAKKRPTYLFNRNTSNTQQNYSEGLFYYKGWADLKREKKQRVYPVLQSPLCTWKSSQPIQFSKPLIRTWAPSENF